MRFNEQAITPNRNGRLGNGFDERGLSARYATALVGLLQTVRDIHHHRCTKLLHFGNVPEINHHIAVTKHISTIREHHTIVSAINAFLHGMIHRIWTSKLTLFDIHPFPSLRSRRQQFGLAEQKRRNLQHVHVLRSHCRFMRFVNVCHGGNPKMSPHFGQNLQGLFIANARKRIHPRPIRFAVTPLKNQGQLKALTHPHQMFSDFKSHVAAFNGTRTGHHKKTVGIGKMKFGNCRDHAAKIFFWVGTNSITVKAEALIVPVFVFPYDFYPPAGTFHGRYQILGLLIAFAIEFHHHETFAQSHL